MLDVAVLAVGDPAVGFTAWLRERVNMGEFFALVLTFIVLAAAAHGTKETGHYLMREGRWRLVGLLLVALGIAALFWWVPVIGALLFLAGVILTLWPAFTATARGVRHVRDWREDRKSRKNRRRS